VIPEAPRLARRSANSFPGMLAWPGTQCRVTVVMFLKEARASLVNLT